MPGLDVLTRSHGALADRAVARRANRGVVEIDLRERQRRARHTELGLRLFDRRHALRPALLQHGLLAALDLHGCVGLDKRGVGSECVGMRLFPALRARRLLSRQLPVAFGIRLAAVRTCPRRGNVRLRGVHHTALLGDLRIERGDIRLLRVQGRERRINDRLSPCDFRRVVRAVDMREHIPLVHRLIVLDLDARHIAGHARTDRHHIRAHIGVVGAFDKTADGPPANAQYGKRDDGDRRARQHKGFPAKRRSLSWNDSGTHIKTLMRN